MDSGEAFGHVSGLSAGRRHVLKSVSIPVERGRRASHSAAARGRSTALRAAPAGAAAAQGAGERARRPAARQQSARRRQRRRMGDEKGPSATKQEIEALCRVFRKLLATDSYAGAGSSAAAAKAVAGPPGGASAGAVHEVTLALAIALHHDLFNRLFNSHLK
ncbi:Protein of unknown function [Gryllus bimaculatus]|nr:Protein of unknown function [Gryllus bimaculatus]